MDSNRELTHRRKVMTAFNMGAVAAACVLIAASASYIFVRVTRPLNELKKQVEEIARGNLDAHVKESFGENTAVSYTHLLSEGDMPPREDMPLVYIHVCGLVCTPGVYGLPAGSRVYEAIEAAGGFSEAAVPDYLNLGQVLEDGMKIQVPDREQAEEWKARGLTQSGISAGAVSAGVQTPGRTGTGEGGAKAMVNLNTASKEDLMTLRGIGESRAEDIIHYREAFGGFKSIEDIMNVSGIKDAAFEKIKDSITV